MMLFKFRETNRLNEDHENSFDMMQPVSPPLLVLAPPPIPVSIPSESERYVLIPSEQNL